MTLTEVYLNNILRPPPTGSVPANVAHPFQTSFYTYFTKKFIPRHWYLAAGATFTLTMYGTLDKLMQGGKKASYDKALEEGRPPCEAGMRVGRKLCLPFGPSARPMPFAPDQKGADGRASTRSVQRGEGNGSLVLTLICAPRHAPVYLPRSRRWRPLKQQRGAIPMHQP
jgi:hypothetical protein